MRYRSTSPAKSFKPGKESGGKLIIDGGVFSNVELSFEAGASLEIKNGGVLIPRNHLIIPLGVEIKIEQGQIVLNDEDD